MTKTTRRRPRAQTDSASANAEQQTMDGRHFCPSSTFLVQKFELNSYDRIVARKGLGRNPDAKFSRKRTSRPNPVSALTGRKCNNLDLSTLSAAFDNYRKAVNLILESVFSNPRYAHALGNKLSDEKIMGYVVLRNETRLKWKPDNRYGKLVYERMHRNALETAARIIYGDFTRRRLVNAALSILASEHTHLIRLMKNKRIPADLIRKVRDTSDKKTGNTYHYALSALRQIRRVLRQVVRASIQTPEGSPIPFVRNLLQSGSSSKSQVESLLIQQVADWQDTEFPFVTPIFRKNTMDFVASTENATTQGYWFRQDSKREDEIILYIKTPPGVLGSDSDSRSPYKSQTLRFRYLNWFPRKASLARRKAQKAREIGGTKRAVELEFRAHRYDDMSQQLLNTIRIQHLTREIANARVQDEKDESRIRLLKKEIDNLKGSRRSAPPIIRITGKKATLIIPFMTPDEDLLEKSLSKTVLHNVAGVDRGLRYSMVVSVKNGTDNYEERMIGKQDLLRKRERLRQRTRELMSRVTLQRNNWEKKHPGLQVPSHVLKKERELDSVWRKVRRLDEELSHQVAAETVWFCEHQKVKTIYFEDLRSFQGKGGLKTHSWNLSSNLWGMMIDSVRYRREALGHKDGGLWMVNPAWTSQTCHVCGERGKRVEQEGYEEETKGGEYFYCPTCSLSIHADVNAARNIMHVNQIKPSAVPGRTA